MKKLKFCIKEKSYSGAYYLAGYSIELALKAAICKKFKSGTIPDKKFVNDLYVHDLEKLMSLSSLKNNYDNEKKNNPELETFWNVITKWTENSRYEIKNEQDSLAIIEAICNQKNGILAWIKQHW